MPKLDKKKIDYNKRDLPEQTKKFQGKYLVANIPKIGSIWNDFNSGDELRYNPKILRELGNDFADLFCHIPKEIENNTKLIVISVFDKYSNAEQKYVVIFSMHAVEDKEGTQEERLQYIGYVNEGGNLRYEKVQTGGDIDYPYFVEYFEKKRPKYNDRILDVWDLLHRPKQIGIPILFTNDKNILEIRDNPELRFPLCMVFAPSGSNQHDTKPIVYLPDSNASFGLKDIWPEIDKDSEIPCKPEEIGWRDEYKWDGKIVDSFYHANIMHYIDAYSRRKPKEKGYAYILEIPITLHSTSDPVLFQTVANLSITLEDLNGSHDEIIKTINFYYGLFRVSINEVVSLPIKNRVLDLTRKNSVRSAAAGIIARNMSHHLGSHVLPRAGVKDIHDRILAITNENQEKKIINRTWDVTIYPMLMNIKDRLDRYLQRKAEFIADFTADPLSTTNSAWLFKDIVFPFLRNTALMDALAANEGFSYKEYDQPGIIIRCFRKYKNEDPIELFPYFPKYLDDQDSKYWSPIPYGERHLQDMTKDSTVKFVNIEHDVRVVTHGVGEMALYGILENIIRNTAKYKAGKEERKSLDIWLFLSENLENDDLFTIDIFENLSDPESAANELNYHLNKEYVNEVGLRRTEAWGIAEMEICADLLIGVDPITTTPHNLNIKVRSPNLPINHSNDKSYLNYSFNLAKARIAVFFGFDLGSSVQKELRRKGYLFEDPDKLCNSKYNTCSQLKGCQFAVINKKLAADIGEDTSWLPFRVIIAGEQEFNNVVKYKTCSVVDENPPFDSEKFAKNGDSDPLILWLWKNWLKYFSSTNNLKDDKLRNVVTLDFDVFFEEEKSKDPTKTWIEAANIFNLANAEDTVPSRIRVWGKGKKGKDVQLFTDFDQYNHGAQRLIVDRHSKFTADSIYPPEYNDRILFIDKKSNDFDTLYNPKFSALCEWQLPFELAEAGLLNVLVIDERIAKMAIRLYDDVSSTRKEFRTAITDCSFGAARILDVAKKAGVFIATHLEINKTPGNNKTFSLLKQKWEDKPQNDSEEDNYHSSYEATSTFYDRYPPLKVNIDLENYFVEDSDEITVDPLTLHFMDVENHPHALFQSDNNKLHLVVIHQGVIDTIFKRNFNNLDRDNFVNILQKNNRWLVIESGRGTPSYVLHSLHKFISYSTLERAFHGGRIAKFMLTQSLMGLTRNRPKMDG